ncbi:hypothetical protein C8R46DRAFT_1345740 [Mycena filopes]|nr:hypothetical protein C8R46DRAFT_1345740 [Mycena filopes]
MLSNISTRRALAPNSTPIPRQLCVYQMPPALLAGPYTPDGDFQSNRVSIRHPVGLGLGGIDSALSQPVNRSRLPALRKRTALRPRVSRTHSSFDCEKSMASMKIDPNSNPIHSARSPMLSSLLLGEPDFNSLRDLDVQHPSSRNLSSLSPPTFSPSWSLDSIISFPSPEATLPPPSSDFSLSTPWASCSKPSTPRSPIAVTAESNWGGRTPDTVVPSSSYNFAAFDPRGFYNVNGASAVRPPLSPARHRLRAQEDAFKSTNFLHHYPNDFAMSLMHLKDTSLPIHEDFPRRCTQGPIFSDHSTFPPMSGVPNVISRPRVVKRKSSTQDVAITKTGKKHTRPISPDSPILDAHRGITQAELEARAYRYRQRNPGVEHIDQQWFASFSGQLSAAGEMIHGFRCYVVGCTQVNKRRDHIVTHVGSHLNERRFKCDQCPSRFVRKNELSRHERSHKLARPFACSHCRGTFKRQDLLTRHLKNVHDMKAHAARKKVKART